jgi:ABC-2 type transport system ATP-binding protein
MDRWLERFDLSSWKDRKIQELSKGMSQKVQFIASIIHDPAYVFFDEPFSGLDPVSSDLLRETILELGAQGKVILFSKHIMEQAEKICSRILLMNKGKEVISGTMEEVKNHYGTRTVVLEFDGDGGFIEHLPFVKHRIAYPRYMEIELTEDGNPDQLLAALVNRVSVRRFEIVAPSLHKIFIDLVRPGTEAGNGGETEEDRNA